MEYVPYPKNTKLNHNMLDDYKKQIIQGTNKKFVYTYHDRFTKHFQTNQYNYITNKLKHNKESRRAVMITWNPTKDTLADEVPCLNYVCCSVYDNKLCMSVVFRSNDIGTAFVPNMYGLHNLHLFFAHQLGLECGDFYYTGHNVHLIKNNL